MKKDAGMFDEAHEVKAAMKAATRNGGNTDAGDTNGAMNSPHASAVRSAINEHRSGMFGHPKTGPNC
jgi:hypothetical protein